MAELDPRAAGGKRLEDKVCVVTGAGQGIGRVGLTTPAMLAGGKEERACNMTCC